MKELLAIVCFVLLRGCAQSITEKHETELSELFNVCVQAPSDAGVLQISPVDAERISYKSAHESYEMKLSHYQGDQSHFEGPVISLGGPLDVLVLGTLATDAGSAYAISFNSLGAFQSRGFGSIAIAHGSQASVDHMFKFLAGWYRCGASPMSANNSFKPKPLRGAA